MNSQAGVFFALTLLTALGCGLIAGLFFAFSTAMMKALARLPAAQGMAAMQAINVVILNPLFRTVFPGTALGCALLIVAALWRWHTVGSGYLLTGAAFYLVGSFLLTVVFNVSRNNALAAVAPADGAELWADYLAGWTAWNHVRTIASLVAAALLGIGLCY